MKSVETARFQVSTCLFSKVERMESGFHWEILASFGTISQVIVAISLNAKYIKMILFLQKYRDNDFAHFCKTSHQDKFIIITEIIAIKHGDCIKNNCVAPVLVISSSSVTSLRSHSVNAATNAAQTPTQLYTYTL